MRDRSLIFVLAVITLTTAGAQTSHRRADPRDRDPIPVEVQAQPKISIDREKVRHDAGELSQLAQTIPQDVQNAAHGVLSKDLNNKLKRIEKLAKTLRGELRLQ